MTEKNPELKTCGVVMGCKDRGVEVIRVEGGGYLGHACIEHAKELDRYLEQMMAVNESLALLDGLSHPTRCRACLVRTTSIPKYRRRTPPDKMLCFVKAGFTH